MSETSPITSALRGRRATIGNAEFEALFELFPSAALVVEAGNHRILLANRHVSELTGWSREEILGQSASVLIPEILQWSQENEQSRAPLVAHLVRGDGLFLEVQVLREVLIPGKRLLLTLQPLDILSREHANSQRGQEIWTNLQALANAQEQEDLHAAIQACLVAAQLLSGASALAVYQIDTQSRENPILYRQATWGKSEVLPESLPPRDLAFLRSPYVWRLGRRPEAALHRAGRMNELAYIATSPLGAPSAAIGLVVIAADGHVIPEPIGRITQLLASEVTTLLELDSLSKNIQHVQREMDKEENLLATIEISVQVGLLILTPDLKVARLNPAAELMLGYSSREVYGQEVSSILVGSDSLKPALHSAQQGIPPANLGDIRLYRRNGDAFLAKVGILPVNTHAGPDTVVVMIHDLSDKEQIREHAQQLEQRALLGEVMAIFSHEVRNPINSISTGLQLMAVQLPPGDPNLRHVEMLMKECDRLAALLNMILQSSRVPNYEMVKLDLGALAKRIIDRFEPKLARVNVLSHLQLDPGCPPVEGNEHALDQVLTNLITNAMEAMSEKGGQLSVKVHPFRNEEGRLRVEVLVHDTGPGIPRELHERIFQLFFTTKKTGTGLGLAISRRICTAHGGSLTVNSFQGGTIFAMQLPAIEN